MIALGAIDTRRFLMIVSMQT
jgi:hypothetical protein